MLNSININSLLVLRKVYSLKSMTKAAKSLLMTQSGVSQHVSTLEDSLNIKLFIRDKKKIIPTKACDALIVTTNKTFNELEQTLFTICGSSTSMEGELIIGVPIEFGNNILFPIMAKLTKEFPAVKLVVKYGLAHEMKNLLLAGELDFAFTDEFEKNYEIDYVNVYTEELVLCCSQSYFNQFENQSNLDKKFFETLKYISYLEDALILKNWFLRAKGIKKIDLNTVMRTEDAQGVLTFILNDMGVGVIPRHMLKAISSSRVHVFDVNKEKVLNNISLSYQAKRIEGPFLQFFLKYFKTAFQTN